MNKLELEQKILNYDLTLNFRDIVKEDLVNNEFVIFDTETTWFGWVNWEIIDLWAIIVSNNKIKAKDGNFYSLEEFLSNDINFMDMFWCLIYPKNGRIPKEITEVTHIDMDTIEAWTKKWVEAPHKTELSFATAFKKFADYVDNRILVAHNNAFDRRIIKENVYNNLDEILEIMSIEEVSKFFDTYTLDTLVEAQNTLKLNPTINYKNSTLADYYGYESNAQMLHRAFYDSVFTSWVFFWLLNDFIRHMEVINREQ